MSVEPNSGEENVPEQFDYTSPKNSLGNSVLARLATRCR